MLIPRLSFLRERWSSLFSNTVIIYINTILNSLLGFIFWRSAAQVYTPSELGIGAAMISAITLLASLADLGLGLTAIRYLPQLEKDSRDDFISSSSFVVTASSLLIALTFLIGIPLWSPELISIHDALDGAIVFIMAATLFSLIQFVDRFYIAAQKTQYLVYRNLIANGIRIILLIVMSNLFTEISFVISVGGGALLSGLISMLIFLPIIYDDIRFRWAFSWKILWSKARFSISNHFSQILWASPPLIYPLVILALLGPEDNATFYISWMLANILFILPNALSSAVLAFVANRDELSSNRLFYFNSDFVCGRNPNRYRINLILWIPVRFLCRRLCTDGATVIDPLDRFDLSIHDKFFGFIRAAD